MKEIVKFILETKNLSSIDDHIKEGLKITSKTKVDKYNYHPQTKDELKELIKTLIKDRGNKADLNDIDVSNVKDMSYMFSGSKFNGDISYWNVGNVEDMACMFGDSKFNGDISEWDVSNVEDMGSMFMDSGFNGDISKWNVSNVKNMSFMFCNSKFNGDISNWDVSKVKRMKYMFKICPLEKNPPKWYKE